MSDFPRWKYALVIVVLALGVLYAVPNIFQRQPAVQISANRGATVDQALDTRVSSILQKHHIPVIKSELDNKKHRLLVRFANPEIQLKASDVIKEALGDQYVVALNLASTVPDWLRSIHANSMRLGLDLQGGVHFLMEVDQQAVRDKQESAYTEDIRSLLRDHRIRYINVARAGDGVGVNVVLRSSADRDQAATLIASNYPDLSLSNGASNDNRYVLTAGLSEDKLRELAQKAITQNVGTLRNRINALGVSEPLIQQQGDSRIVVELAGVQDTAEAKKMLGATATLEYRADYGTPQQAIQAEKTGIVPPEARLYHMRSGQPVLLSKKVIATGDQLLNASSGIDPQTGTPSVSVTLNSAAAKRMFDFTSANVGKLMGVVYKETIPETKIIDGKKVRTSKTTEVVINNATIQGVFSNKFQTTGLDSPEAASQLALLLRSGSLAAPVQIVEERVIGPSLGRDNIHKGVLAVLVGLAAVLLCAGFYYKLFGLVADIALFFNLVLLVAVMSMIGVTLTMPGIAGIVLTLGMAIDSNVLICERVREELRNGSTPLASIRAGYEKAWSTILDANVTHLLAALALMTMGTGSIKGFGVTLFIGILTSLFTSVTVTHAITALIHGGRKLKSLSV
ncbi:MAG TPA: protein translocase subunit SecD [Rhodanobacteraceae bacterium]|nr:protein translocase subunit SecD [Rhodanobacteraceae bacterium]